jgi:2-keto-3-deoxy-L-rhamnonate aldolase RhmA
MNAAAIRTLRRKLAENVCTYGLWVTLESPSITEMGVALGLDWICIDAEHGHLGWQEIVAHLRCAVRSDTVMLVRVSDSSPSLVKRSLDLGADGIVFPWISTADEVRHAVACCKFPPEGIRGIGGERATHWGQNLAQHAAEANEHVLVVPMFETVAAESNLDAMCDVPGADIYWFGPADFSSTAGHRGQWEGPGVAKRLIAAKDKIRAAGKHCGVMARGRDDLTARREQGFRLISLGSDAGLILRTLREDFAAAKGQ